jgi:hypothetical protein
MTLRPNRIGMVNLSALAYSPGPAIAAFPRIRIT